MNRATPVADISTVLRIIAQLRCRGLGPLKAQICDVFCRCMGGDRNRIPLSPVTESSVDQEMGGDWESAAGGAGHPAPVVIVDGFRTDLARLLPKDPEQIGRIRRLEGAPPQYSLLDVIICITGQASRNATNTLKEAVQCDEGMACNISHTPDDASAIIGHIPSSDSTGRRDEGMTCNIRHRRRDDR